MTDFSDRTHLVSDDNGAPEPAKGRPQPDWGRYGLSPDQRDHHDDDVFEHHPDTEHNELFREDQSAQSKPWWKANFFISEPVLFGTWDGVFTSCMINIFGVVIFLRTGWMVGNAGIGFSVLIIFMTIAVALLAALSAIGVCERCKMESGGVYFLLSHVLGARIGASIGIIYCFGQAVACSLYVVGFGESIAGLLHQDNVWISRGIGAAVIFLLLGINVAGVKWVIRLQLILLMVLFVAMLDFLVGSFVHTDPGSGFVGYNSEILHNNTGPAYMEGETFFTVFGVFFPTATGVFAGINMSGDLRHPSRNIPVGTLSAVGVSTVLYLAFAIVLGATCMRDYLQTDYMIAEKVSIVGVLFLAGLYISSISSCMGGLYGSPRILQCIANENVIPIMKALGQGVSIVKVLFIAGMHEFSLSSAVGSFGGGPKNLQRIVVDGTIPFLKPAWRYTIMVSLTHVFSVLGMYVTSLSCAVGYFGGLPDILHKIASDRTIKYLEWLEYKHKVSATRFLTMTGLYVISLSCAVGNYSGSPDIFQKVAEDRTIKHVDFLAVKHQRGPNKVPVFALVVITLISLLFVFIGKVNTLGPIVTMPFMITYAAVDYAYFCLAMSYDKKRAYEARFEKNMKHSQSNGVHKQPGDTDSLSHSKQSMGGGYGAVKPANDLDNLFPERTAHDGTGRQLEKKPSISSPTFLNEEDGKMLGGGGDAAELLPGQEGSQGGEKPLSDEITRQPRSFYSIFCNRWLSLLGCVVSFVIMFAIQWGYALATITIILVVYIYIGQANPGVFPGIADFSMWEWVRDSVKNCCRRGPPPPEEIVVTPNTPAMSTMAAQLTEDNEDFASRGRYHQSEIVKGEKFDDPYDSP